MLAVLAIIIVVVFFILLRSGILDDLPEYLNQARPDIQSWRPSDSNSRRYDPNSDNRLEIFKDFFEEKEDEDQDN